MPSGESFAGTAAGVNNKSLWKISVVTTPEAEEIVAELLETILAKPAVSWTDVETGTVTVSAYLPSRPPSLSQMLAQQLARLRRQGLKPGSGRVLKQKIRREDWAESW